MLGKYFALRLQVAHDALQRSASEQPMKCSMEVKQMHLIVLSFCLVKPTFFNVKMTIIWVLDSMNFFGCPPCLEEEFLAVRSGKL